MRYRKTIKVCKGVKLNVSKSGFSVTTGGKGLSLNAGARGLYLNTGIPGTGLYDRTKIAGGSSTPSRAKNTSTAKPSGSYDIHMDDDGLITISQNGRRILDEALLRKIKQTPEFKSEKVRLDRERRYEVAVKVSTHNQSAEQIIGIAGMSEEVQSARAVQALLASLEPQTYSVRNFMKEKPSKHKIEAKLMAEAEKQISSVAFWTVKKKRQKYVDDRLEAQYAEEVAKWQVEKTAFDEQEQTIANSKNAEYLAEYEDQRAYLECLLMGDPEFIEQQIARRIAEIELPLDFSLQYEYDPESSNLYVDLDLPEIDDLPDEVAVQMANGTMKIKKKPQTALRNDYAKCVFGFAVFFASVFFNVSVVISKILISGYTQRRDKDGNLNDDYIFSLIFDRNTFEQKRPTLADPIEYCMTFENRCNLTKSNIFKTIKPFDTI